MVEELRVPNTYLQSYLRCLILNCAEYLLAMEWEHKAQGCDYVCVLGS